MRYGRIDAERGLVIAPDPLEVEGRLVHRAPAALYKAAGWLPIVAADPWPDSTECVYIQQGEIIRQVWDGNDDGFIGRLKG